MQLKHADSVNAETVQAEGAQDVQMRKLIHQGDGAENFVMRQFTLKYGAHTPHHAHDWEHEVYILRGQAVVVAEDGERSVPSGTCLFIPPGEKHQFRNESDETLEFLCLVPASAG